LAAQAGQVEARLAILAPGSKEMPISTSKARTQLEIKNSREEELTLFQKMFSKSYRPAWVVGEGRHPNGLLFPLRRQPIASWLFRVEKFTVCRSARVICPTELDFVFENYSRHEIEEL
jgi:hypothetical protein